MVRNYIRRFEEELNSKVKLDILFYKEFGKKLRCNYMELCDAQIRLLFNFRSAAGKTLHKTLHHIMSQTHIGVLDSVTLDATRGLL